MHTVYIQRKPFDLEKQRTSASPGVRLSQDGHTGISTVGWDLRLEPGGEKVKKAKHWEEVRTGLTKKKI